MEPRKMNPKVKELWAAALESGRYKQGKGALRQDDLFCVLGVLCDLHNKHAVDGMEWIEGPDSVFLMGGTTGTLPLRVSQWAGLERMQNPVVFYDGGLRSMSCANDVYDLTLKEIATLIRKQF